MADPMDAADEGEGVSAGRPYLDGLLMALRWLDRLLADAAVAAQAAYGADAVTDRYRGLYISWDEMERLLAREPGAPAFTLNEPDTAENLLDAAGETSRLAWLQRAFGLSPFDIEVLLIALAPELDLRYERLYA